MKKAAIILGLLAISSTAQAQNANDCRALKEACASSHEFSSGYCLGFALGVAITHKSLCIPSGATNDQVRAVLAKWLSDHPEEWHQPAGHCANEALQKSFSCSAK